MNSDDEPDLFSEPEPEEWHEVSQARFLSWSESMQLSYCAARDINSSLSADNPTDAAWYLWRARLYGAC